MNYGFYKSAYGGNTIPPELFNRFLFKAQTYLEGLTMGRDIPDNYKDRYSFALCEIAECYYTAKCDVKSENNDGYSVSYSDIPLTKRLYEIADLYLGESGLLYKGEY